MNNIRKAWNKEYCELFATQYDDETLLYDEDMSNKELDYQVN